MVIPLILVLALLYPFMPGVVVALALIILALVLLYYILGFGLFIVAVIIAIRDGD